MFCQAVAERELACQLMGHVQCEPRILQLLSPFLPLSAHFSFIQPRLVSAARISFPLSLPPSLFLSLALSLVLSVLLAVQSVAFERTAPSSDIEMYLAKKKRIST